MADYINVTSLNRLAKQVLAQCDPLNDLIVCGVKFKSCAWERNITVLMAAFSSFSVKYRWPLL